MNNAVETLKLIAYDILEVPPHETRNISIIMSMSLYNRLSGGYSFTDDSYKTLFGVPLEVVNDCGYWWCIGIKHYAHLQQEANTDE